MILKRKYEGCCIDEYYCELTKELDILSWLNKRESYEGYKYRHYIYATDSDKKEHCYAIRVPVWTLGDIVANNDDYIIDITIYTNYVIRTYPHNVNEIIKKKYIGKKIEFERWNRWLQ